ncbi:PepSY domain-containing protein [Streptomyces sp. NBC_01012]|uniref:PepSY domain-containing protein n=1 Tax=Streptomyces sp. NBC_01012 TaxID=2903717 RepID=UPI003864EDEE|nr:PepSY domain-containing protein [Streptomyces sp. NBC_01012]
MQRNIAVVALTAAVLIGGLAGCNDGNGGDNDNDSGRGDSAPVPVTSDSVTVDDAVAAALKAVPGRVTEAELENDANTLVWKLDVYGSDKVWHDVKIDADDAKVLSDRGDANNRRPVPGSSSVSVIDAVEAARKAQPGTVTSVDLDADENTLVWDVVVKGKDGGNHELDVDAQTAEVSGNHGGGDDN